MNIERKIDRLEYRILGTYYVLIFFISLITIEISHTINPLNNTELTLLYTVLLFTISISLYFYYLGFLKSRNNTSRSTNRRFDKRW